EVSPSAEMTFTRTVELCPFASSLVETLTVTPRDSAMDIALTKVTTSLVTPENRPRTADRPRTSTYSVESCPHAVTSMATGAELRNFPDARPSLRARSSQPATSSPTEPPETLTASGTNSPAKALSTESATSVTARSCASTVDAPKCGVTTTCGSPNSGESVHGSVAYTSKPAPQWWPALIESAKACSSTSPPRAALMMICPFFALPKSSEENIPAVSGVFGR